MISTNLPTENTLTPCVKRLLDDVGKASMEVTGTLGNQLLVDGLTKVGSQFSLSMCACGENEIPRRISRLSVSETVNHMVNIVSLNIIPRSGDANEERE